MGEKYKNKMRGFPDGKPLCVDGVLFSPFHAIDDLGEACVIDVERSVANRAFVEELTVYRAAGSFQVVTERDDERIDVAHVALRCEHELDAITVGDVGAVEASVEELFDET